MFAFEFSDHLMSMYVYTCTYSILQHHAYAYTALQVCRGHYVLAWMIWTNCPSLSGGCQSHPCGCIQQCHAPPLDVGSCRMLSEGTLQCRHIIYQTTSTGYIIESKASLKFWRKCAHSQQWREMNAQLADQEAQEAGWCQATSCSQADAQEACMKKQAWWTESSAHDAKLWCSRSTGSSRPK